MSTLYIRVPSRSVADGTSHWIALACPYAVASGTGAVEREGVATLNALASTIAQVQRVVILLAASDVTLLQLSVPPMSQARLRAALPHLVEEHLVTDPAECVIVTAARSGKVPASGSDLRIVAVMQRAWLQILLQTFVTYGARHILAIPSQSCLRSENGTVVAALTVFGAESGNMAGEAMEMALRLSTAEGFGLSPAIDRHADTGSIATEALEALCAIVPLAPITLYVPQQMVLAYQQSADALLPLDQRVTVYADQWAHWIDGVRDAGLDLSVGIDRSASAAADLRRWRWPLIIAVLVIAANVLAVNVQWWQLARESAQLRRSMLQTYQSAFPKETVIVDPVAQMQQKIGIVRHESGQPAPDDFVALIADFAVVWNSFGQTGASATGSATTGSATVQTRATTPIPKPELAAIEYRDRNLYVRLKNPDDFSSASLASLKTALSARHLVVTQAPPGTWQIRHAK